MTLKNYVNLHGHTNDSIGDAIGSPVEHIDFAISNGAKAIALTDHGNMINFSAAYLYSQKLQEQGQDFKVIYGTEAYFIDDLEEWHDEYQEYKKSLKNKKTKKEEKGIEDDRTRGKVGRNPINRRYHLVLLAKNETGLKNLFKLISQSNSDYNYYRYPRIDYKMLEEHSEGLICLSACMGSRMANVYFKYKDKKNKEEQIIKEMTEVAEKHRSIFGKDYYLELQWNAFEDQHTIKQYIIQVAQKLDIKLVSTTDAHYHKPELWQSREMYKRLAWLSKGKGEPLPESIEELGMELYPKNGEQMWDSYLNYGNGYTYDDNTIEDSITRTKEIADEIEVIKVKTDVEFPDFVSPEGKDAGEYLKELCYSSMIEKNLDNDKYSSRLEYELDVIIKRGFAEYFLLMNEIIEEAKRTQLVGPGRGSCGGSLIAYLLEITQIDPIRWGMQFERFLDIEGNSFPDIDVDFEDRAGLREIIEKKWKEKYGVDVVQISNFTTLKLKSLIKDLSKYHEIPYKEVNIVTTAMFEESESSIKEERGITAGILDNPTLDEVKKHSPSLREFLDNHPEVSKHMGALEGQKRSIGKHAAGIVIGSNITEKMPLVRSKGTLQTPWTEGISARHLEPLGFLKFDLLGLETLGMIRGAIEHTLKRHYNMPNPEFKDIQDYYNKNLHPDVLDFSDKMVYNNVYQGGNFVGIFQFARDNVQQFCMDVNPKGLRDVSAVTAIHRPGPLIAGVHRKFIKNRANSNSIGYQHPITKEVLKDNAGLVIYQEDIANLTHKLGKDLSLAEGNKLRKLLMKKGLGETGGKKEQIYKKFLAGCLEKGITKKEAEKMWKEFEGHSKYSFNFSHSLMYSAISYQCSWLLTHYPAEWIASYLQREKPANKEQAISSAKKAGFKIEDVNINTSGKVWEISEDGKTLIQPLNSLKGVGDAAVEEILKFRPFNTVEELLFNKEIRYGKLNKKVMDAFARVGALKDLYKDDSRFNHLRHFWSSTILVRPTSLKKMLEAVDAFKDEDDFSQDDMITMKSELTGMYPIELIMSDELDTRLKNKEIQSLGSISKKENGVHLCWTIPKEIKTLRTTRGSQYLIVTCIDDTFEIVKIKCWNVNPKSDTIALNRVYAVKLKYDKKWGYSCDDFGKCFKRLT